MINALRFINISKTIFYGVTVARGFHCFGVFSFWPVHLLGYAPCPGFACLLSTYFLVYLSNVSHSISLTYRIYSFSTCFFFGKGALSNFKLFISPADSATILVHLRVFEIWVTKI